VTVGPQWYKSTVGPLFALLLLLMGVVPLTAWGVSTFRALGRLIWMPAALSLIVPGVLILIGLRSAGGILTLWLAGLAVLVLIFDFVHTAIVRSKNTGEGGFKPVWNLVRKNPRRTGGQLIHLGVVLMAVGVVGIEFFQTQTQMTIPVGGEIKLAGYSLQLDDFTTTKTGNTLETTTAVMSVTKKSRAITTLRPQQTYYVKAGQTVTVPGLLSTLSGDVYVVLVDWQSDSAPAATLKVYNNPLINWFWIGAIVLMLGGIAAYWPKRRVEIKSVSK